MTDNHINIRPKHQYLDGSRVKADPFTRGACAEASAGAITCIIWCNTSQYTPLQALSPRPRAAALLPSSPSLGNLRKSIASDINIKCQQPKSTIPGIRSIGACIESKNIFLHSLAVFTNIHDEIRCLAISSEHIASSHRWPSVLLCYHIYFIGCPQL